MRSELVTPLKRQATRLISEIEQTREPMMITHHGLPSAYLVDAETWQRLVERVRLLEGIARGERALEEGRTVSHAQARKRLARWLK